MSHRFLTSLLVSKGFIAFGAQKPLKTKARALPRPRTAYFAGFFTPWAPWDPLGPPRNPIFHCLFTPLGPPGIPWDPQGSPRNLQNYLKHFIKTIPREAPQIFDFVDFAF